MNPIYPGIKTVKDYVPVIENAVELYELYLVNIQLETLKNDLLKKKVPSGNEAKITAEINFIKKLQDLCKRRAP